MPSDADVAAVFFEPGQLDSPSSVSEEFLGQGWQDGGGDAEADQLRRLSEIGAEVRDGELGCLGSLFCPARTFTC